MAQESGPFLHLVYTESPAAHVRMALETLGRRERVLHTEDALSVGPLWDLDEGARSRVAWWSLVRGRPSAGYAKAIDDMKLWRRVARDTRPIIIWHGPYPDERLQLLRACWHLRRSPERVHEVRLPRPENRRREAFYGCVGIAGPTRLAEAWSTRRRVRNVAALARRWAELRVARRPSIRDLVGDRFVELPLTAFDQRLSEACAAEWTRTRSVLGRVVAHTPHSFQVICWRVRELVATGGLEARGGPADFGLPAEVRSTR